MAPHSSVLAWRVPGTGSHRVGHDWSDLAAAAAAWSLGCGVYVGGVGLGQREGRLPGQAGPRREGLCEPHCRLKCAPWARGQRSRASLGLRLPAARWPPTVSLKALLAFHLHRWPLSWSLRLCAIQPLLLQPQLPGATQPSPAGLPSAAPINHAPSAYSLHIAVPSAWHALPPRGFPPRPPTGISPPRDAEEPL